MPASAPGSCHSPRGLTEAPLELRKLQHLRDLLTAAGHDAADAVVGLFSATGFTDELAAKATASKGKILLATLDELYGQPS